VIKGSKRRGTVLTVCSSGQSAEVFEYEENLIAAPDTGLKPGVNERSHFQTFEATLKRYKVVSCICRWLGEEYRVPFGRYSYGDDSTSTEIPWVKLRND
jgi:hypothetical protein